MADIDKGLPNTRTKIDIPSEEEMTEEVSVQEEEAQQKGPVEVTPEEEKFFDLDMFDKNVAESRAAEEKLAKEDLERQEKRKTPFDLSDPFMAADGGLSGGDKSGPAPESGPTPHGEEGLPGILKRVKKI